MPQDQTLVRLDIPPDAHPAALRSLKHLGEDDPLRRTARAALASLYDARGRINDLGAKVDNLPALAEAAVPVVERVIARADRDLAGLRARRDELEKRIVGALQPAAQSPYAGEVRAHLKEQGDAAARALTTQIMAGRLDVAQAAFSAPPMLSGLSPKQHEEAFAQARRVLCADDQAAAEDLDRAVALLERSATHFAKTMAEHVREWRDDSHELIKRGLSDVA